MENSTLNSKNIKKFIIDAKNDLELLMDYLEQDYQATIEGIFNAIFTLIRHYDQNKSRVDYLILLLEGLIEIKSVEDLKKMEGPIMDFNNKVSLWRLKEQMSIAEPYKRIQNLLYSIQKKEVHSFNNEKVKYLSFLIFEDKNLNMIENYLNISGNLLNSRNKDGNNIFDTLINTYLYLDEKNWEDIEYYYQVILLFMKSKYEHIILKDKNNYFRRIKTSKLEYKIHIIHLLELFNPEFSISLKEIEERYKVDFSFPNIIKWEVNNFAYKKVDRYDFTYQNCLTIDGPSSECLDDALYIEENIDGTYNLYVHIVDITSLIPYNSLTLEEAMKRGESLYLKDRIVPLYPSIICNNLCSLLPGEEKDVLTHIFRLDSNFKLITDEVNIVRGKIKVKTRLTYESADYHIKNYENTDLDKTLYKLFLFSDARRGDNRKKEEYYSLQNKISPNPLHESSKIDTSPSSNIVHEAMILVNYLDALLFKNKKLPYCYRKLELPEEDFLNKQLRLLEQLDSKYVQSEEFQYKFRWSYAKPEYTQKPVYHNGLRLQCYSHSTSPARRCADGVNQYLINDLILDGVIDDFNIYKWEYHIKYLVQSLNEIKNKNENFSRQYNYLAHKKLIKK